MRISKNLASRMNVCRKVYNEDGNRCNAFEEGRLHEFDKVVVVRCPSLSHLNTQPMTIRFWDKDVAGFILKHSRSFMVTLMETSYMGILCTTKTPSSNVTPWKVPSLLAFDAGRDAGSSAKSTTTPYAHISAMRSDHIHGLRTCI